MSLVTLLGLFATCLSMVTFIPQAWQCFRTKETHDISLPSYGILELASLTWLCYGILQKDFPVILANTIMALVAFSIILLKLKYK